MSDAKALLHDRERRAQACLRLYDTDDENLLLLLAVWCRKDDRVLLEGMPVDDLHSYHHNRYLGSEDDYFTRDWVLPFNYILWSSP